MTKSETVPMKGYVTTYKSVVGRTHSDLEAVLGLGPGALSNGYAVYQLAEAVGPGDFEWKDRTRYSDGWRGDRSIGYCVRRVDELRADLGKKHGYGESAVDRKLADFHAIQQKKINVRSGPDRIVKVVPSIEGKSYPDSPYGHIPQWRLSNKKSFTFIGNSV